MTHGPIYNLICSKPQMGINVEKHYPLFTTFDICMFCSQNLRFLLYSIEPVTLSGSTFLIFICLHFRIAFIEPVTWEMLAYDKFELKKHYLSLDIGYPNGLDNSFFQNCGQHMNVNMPMTMHLKYYIYGQALNQFIIYIRYHQIRLHGGTKCSIKT